MVDLFAKVYFLKSALFGSQLTFKKVSGAFIENELKFSITILKIKTKMGRARTVYPKSTLGLINWDLN